MSCRVILTWLSLLWLVLSIVSTFTMVYSIFSAKWVLGPEQNIYENSTIVGTSWPSVGVVSRCLRVEGKRSCALFILDGLATDPEVFPTIWKISFVFFCAGLVIMSTTCLFAALSICVQITFGKSIFTLTGFIQAVAGLFFLVGLLLYGGGWGSTRVMRLCGSEAQPYHLGDCTLGWGSYAAAIGIVLTMATAGLSVKAEKATNTDKVRNHVESGEVFVCLL